MSESRRIGRGIVVLMGVVGGLAALPGGAGAAQFADTVLVFSLSGTPNSIGDGDFNGDGDPDIVAGRYSGASVAVSLGKPGFDFTAFESYPAGSSPAAVGSADLNGDGDPELVVGNRASDNVSVLIGGEGGSFSPGPGPFPAGNGPEDLVVGDFNGDGNPDLAVANFFSAAGDVSILEGTGGGNFAAPTTISTGDFATQAVGVGDFNDDGDPDLAATSGINSSTGRVAIFLGGPGMGFSAPQVNPISGIPRTVMVGDFNGDGREDVGVPASGTLYVMTGNPDGTFAFGPHSELGTLGIGVDGADFNGDDDLDLVLAFAGDYEAGVTYGGPGASFGVPELLPAPFENFDVVAGDYTEDGHPEFAVAGQSNEVWVYRNTGETAQPPAPTARCLGKKATIVGTAGDDLLRGTRKADVIAGLDGDDTLRGRGGKDRLCGGGDKDKLIGGPARDRCAGGPARDTERGCP